MRDGFPWAERIRRMQGLPELAFRARELVRRRMPMDAASPLAIGWPVEGRPRGLAMDQARALAAGRTQGLGMLQVPLPAERMHAFDRDPLTGEPWTPGPAFGLRWGDIDPKPTWELNRLQHLPGMALVSPEAAADDLQAWLGLHPMGQTLAWSVGVEVAHRLVSLLALRSLLEAHPVRGSLEQSLGDHVAWLKRHPSRFSSANNHRLAELCALWIAAHCGPGVEEGALARELLALAEVLLGGGLGAEGCSGYLVSGLDWLLAAQAVSQGGLGRRADVLIAHGTEVLRGLMDAGGQVQRWGDGDDGRVWRAAMNGVDAPRSVCGAAGAWLGRPALVPLGWEPDLRAWWLGLGEMDAHHSPIESRCMPGLTRLVSGQAVVHLRHGSPGLAPLYAHSHCDALALTLRIGGHEVLVDAGSYLYSGAPEWRRWLRSSRAHNTAWMEGAEQSALNEAWLSQPLGQARLEAVDLARGQLEMVFDGPWRHRREVQLGRGHLVVRDRIWGRPGAVVGMGWLFAPQRSVVADGPVLTVGGVPDHALRIHMVGPSGVLHRQRQSPGFGACSVAYGRLTEATQWVGQADGQAEWITRIEWSAGHR